MQRKHQEENTPCDCFGRLCLLSSHITLIKDPANIVTHLINPAGQTLSHCARNFVNAERILSSKSATYLSYFGEICGKRS